MKIGYARVSTQDQNLSLQLEALKKEGCDEIFHEKISSGSTRPQLSKLLSSLKEGDTLVVWKIDRLARSILELISIVLDLHEKKVKFKSLQETFDTTTPMGLVIINILAFGAELERNNIRERTRAGLEAARKEGRVGGRPRGLSEKSRPIALMAKRYADQGMSVSAIGRELGIHRNTVNRYLAWMKEIQKE